MSIFSNTIIVKLRRFNIIFITIFLVSQSGSHLIFSGKNIICKKSKNCNKSKPGTVKSVLEDSFEYKTVLNRRLKKS